MSPKDVPLWAWPALVLCAIVGTASGMGIAMLTEPKPDPAKVFNETLKKNLEKAARELGQQ